MIRCYRESVFSSVEVRVPNLPRTLMFNTIVVSSLSEIFKACTEIIHRYDVERAVVKT